MASLEDQEMGDYHLRSSVSKVQKSQRPLESDFFDRYASARSQDLDENKVFGKAFLENYAVKLLEAFILLLDQSGGQLPKKVTSYCLSFLSNR